MDSRISRVVADAMKATPSFPKIKRNVFNNFCDDLALVASGFRWVLYTDSNSILIVSQRTAYLVDTFSVSQATANHFTTNLQLVRVIVSFSIAGIILL